MSRAQTAAGNPKERSESGLSHGNGGELFGYCGIVEDCPIIWYFFLHARQLHRPQRVPTRPHSIEIREKWQLQRHEDSIATKELTESASLFQREQRNCC